ncbi:MAG: HAMP domain-containing histidine kinase [Firmicutes bacterium]|nr:HAMP domain-containing histidine kinase [Bacillota bacterium]
MPFVVVIFLVFALFLVAGIPRGMHAVWLGLTLATFGCCLLGLIGLITRFGNYRLEGLIVLPLDQPAWSGDLLGRLTLSGFMRFRLWTLAGFIVSVLGFSFNYTVERWRWREGALAAFFALVVGFLLWFYDPGQLFALYRRGTFFLGNARAWARWINRRELLDGVGFGLVILLLAYSLGRLFFFWRHLSIPQKRAQVLCIGIGHGLLAGFFIGLCCLGPAKVLNARAVATKLLPVAGYPVFDITLLLAVPFAGLLVLGAVLLSILRFGFLGTWHMGTRELDRQIRVANAAIRLVFHSFKNRFLAVQMAMDMAALQLERIADPRGEEVKLKIHEARHICEEALAQLDMLQAQAGRLRINPGPLCLDEIWEEAASRCATRLTAVAVSVHHREPALRVWGDREHLVAVLENLIQNALDALAQREGGFFGPRLWVETGREYEWAYIRITDNGPGIPPENLRKIFRPFFTTKPSKNNWGMGLAYCHRVLKAHGGFINMRSRMGQGTMVEIVLRCR